MAGLSRAIPCPFRMPPAWPAGVGSQAKQKFVVTYTSPFTPTPVLIQICSGARCYSRLRCGVGLLQIYYERHKNVYKGKGRRLYMDEAERAKTKKADEWSSMTVQEKLISMGWTPTPYGLKSPAWRSIKKD